MFIHWHIHKHSLRQLTPHTIQMVISVYAVHIENATNVGVKDLQIYHPTFCQQKHL